MAAARLVSRPPDARGGGVKGVGWGGGQKASITSRFRPTWKTCFNGPVIKAMEMEGGARVKYFGPSKSGKLDALSDANEPRAVGRCAGRFFFTWLICIRLPFIWSCRAPGEGPTPPRERFQLDDVDGVALDGYLIQFHVLERKFFRRQGSS